MKLKEPTAPRANRFCANTVMEGYAFHSDAIAAIEDEYGEDMLWHMVERTREECDSMSTSFSGIEAPHTAACANRVALANHLGIPHTEVGMPRLKHMIEWDAENQAELLLVAEHTGACLFSESCFEFPGRNFVFLVCVASLLNFNMVLLPLLSSVSVTLDEIRYHMWQFSLSLPRDCPVIDMSYSNCANLRT